MKTSIGGAIGLGTVPWWSRGGPRTRPQCEGMIRAAEWVEAWAARTAATETALWLLRPRCSGRVPVREDVWEYRLLGAALEDGRVWVLDSKLDPETVVALATWVWTTWGMDPVSLPVPAQTGRQGSDADAGGA